MGFFIIENLCILPIDKLLGLWYNGNSARQGRGRAAEKTNGKSAHEFSRRRLMPSQKNRKEKGNAACVSCVSATFFQPARSGSHLYSAHRNTVRSGHRDLVLPGSCEPSPSASAVPHLVLLV